MDDAKVSLSKVVAPPFYSIHKAIKQHLYTHYWLKGGRGSTKSSFAAIEIVLGIMRDKDANACALRKVKDTLKDSVYEQLWWAIEVLGAEAFWSRSLSPLALTYRPTGQKILFRGADKPKKIKSIKFAKGYCKYVWYEELDEFNGIEEIRLINQSLLRGGSSFTVFYSYNPPKSSVNWVNAEAQLTQPDRLVHHSDYQSVPKAWLGDQFILEAEHLKQVNPTAYEHEYLGLVTGTGGEVFKNVQIRPITDDEIADFENVNRGIDFGYAVDPFVYSVVEYNRKYRRLYVHYEIYKTGLSNRAAYDLVGVENEYNDLIMADSAEPKSIDELCQYGLQVIGVKKGKDSVNFGIKWLQDLEAIVIDDKRCPNTAREFMNYEMEKDVNGNYKAKFPDRNNHTIDAVRYAENEEWIDYSSAGAFMPGKTDNSRSQPDFDDDDDDDEPAEGVRFWNL